MNDSERELFLKALDNLPQDIQSAKYGSDPGAEKPTRPRAVHDLTVDLHGYTKDRALARVRSVLSRAKGKRLRILIITGRGNNSEGGVGILRKAVEDFLQKAGAPFVREYGPAAPEFGGDGAFDILTK
ncbi:MAG: Smr/MutS family protein [Candidatus Latescibacter sp.]|nr:Smr/MutS family protein [Candidatus Latescibacter sp.]